MKVILDIDEWYPVFSLENREQVHDWQKVVDVPEELFKEHERVMKEFQALQDKLAEYE